MKPNILFLIIDSLVPSKCYGSDKHSVTPNLDNIIKNGIYFPQTITSASATLPSIASTFTSCYPFKSIIQTDDRFKINPKIDHYVKHLKNFGYTVHTLVTELMEHFGLAELYDENKEIYASSTTLYDGLGKSIVDKIESLNNHEPWFYYSHIMDLHGTKKFIIKEYFKKFQNPKFGTNVYEQMLSALDVWLGKIIEKVDLKKTLVIISADHGVEDAYFTEEHSKLKEKTREYEPSMSFKIGKKIFSNLPDSFNPLRKKLAENYSEKKSTKYTDIIENEVSKINNSKLSPYEKRIRKNIIQHVSSAYDERFLIPLIFFGYDTPKGKIISQQVRSIDIFPTVAKIIGMPNPKTIQGRNLFPLIERKNIDELPAYVDSARNHISSVTANVVGIRTSKYKYFRNRKLPEKNVHLFDLEKDPKEENNIANEKPEIIKLMETNLEQINDKKSFDFEIADETIDSKEKEEMDKVLRELGYFN